jgi:hypothetical protein
MVYEGFEEKIGESTKNLSGKTEANAMDSTMALFAEIEMYSGKDGGASGTAGLVARGTGKILVDENGHEYSQLIEKGLMGSCFYYQITSKYLSDSKIGELVENSKDEEGKNYTEKEHHFDEAFGYFGVPTDWDKKSNGEYWGKYCNKRNELLGTNDIFDDFVSGRKAISNDVHKDQITPVENIKSKIEKVAASTAISYFNAWKTKVSDGDKLHALSEGICFLRACQYGGPLVDADDVTAVEEALGENFWNVDDAKIDAAVNLLASAAGLESVKTQLK